MESKALTNYAIPEVDEAEEHSLGGSELAGISLKQDVFATSGSKQGAAQQVRELSLSYEETKALRREQEKTAQKAARLRKREI